MNHKFGRSAFTLLEILFVIVILGIIASIGSELIVKVYQQYIVQRAQHRASIKTELAATQIANRLASAIPGTVYRIKNDNTYESLDSNFSGGSNDDSYKGLQWVSADADSFTATRIPGWSGFCDIEESNQTTIETPGSALESSSTIINNLSASNLNPKIYFPYDYTAYDARIAGTTITLTGAGASHIVEHYKLAWSSYAVVVEGGDLYLYYDFPASPAEPLGNTKSLLMKSISTFKFKGAGRTIRFKICKEEEIGEDYNITACKEKAVF
jgi:prepilin-type N-terminal cleavage/methylation domain-containing protein